MNYLKKLRIPKKLETMIKLYNFMLAPSKFKEFSTVRCIFFEYVYGFENVIDSAINAGLAQRFQNGFSIKKIYFVNFYLLFIVLERNSETITDCIICSDTARYRTIFLGYSIGCNCVACRFIKGFPREVNIEDIMGALESMEEGYEKWMSNEAQDDPARIYKQAHFRAIIGNLNNNLALTRERIEKLRQYISNYIRDCQQKDAN